MEILKKPEHIISLATGGILLRAKVTVHTFTKQDRQISDEVTSAKKAARNAGRYTKQLFADVPELRALLNDRQTWYNFVQKVTYPWDGEWGYLPVARIAQVMAEIEQRKAASAELLEKFIHVMPQAISNEAFAQGDMFNRDDYPDPDTVRSKFKVIVQTMNVPEGDYRVEIATHLADDLQKNFEQQTRDIIGEIHSKQQEQLLKVLQSLSYCCDSETVEENGEIKVKRRKLYESTLTDAMELCNTFAEFNLTNDTKLEEASRSLLKILDGVTVEQLRNSDTKRIVVKEGVDDILSKFGM
jgi:polyhydroxyalkanoate synthesis regulator phasin